MKWNPPPAGVQPIRRVFENVNGRPWPGDTTARRRIPATMAEDGRGRPAETSAETQKQRPRRQARTAGETIRAAGKLLLIFVFWPVILFIG